MLPLQITLSGTLRRAAGQQLGALNRGDRLLAPDGDTTAVVARGESTGRVSTVYSLSVAGARMFTLVAGADAIAVHNEIGCPRHPQEGVEFPNKDCNGSGTHCPRGTDNTREMTVQRGVEGLKEVFSKATDGQSSPELIAALTAFAIAKVIDT